MGVLSVNKREVTIRNEFREVDGKECFLRGGHLFENVSLLRVTTDDINFGKALVMLRMLSSEICVQVHDIKWISESKSFELVVEKLRFQRDANDPNVRIPLTLSAIAMSLPLFTDYFPQQRMFSIKFKTFIRKTIKLIEERARDGVFIQISHDNIFVNTHDEMKLLDLSSHFTEIKESYESLYSTIKEIVQLAKETWGEQNIAGEVEHFTVYPNIPRNLKMLWHPCILLPEGKLHMYRRMYHALRFTTFLNPRPLFSWMTKFKKYPILNDLITNPRSGAYADTLMELLRAIENMRKHLNEAVIKFAPQHTSPLSKHDSSSMYIGMERELMIDALSPQLAITVYEFLVTNEAQLVRYFEQPKLEDL